MKRLLVPLFLLACTLSVFAANPAYQNFDTNFFLLSGMGPGSTISFQPGLVGGSTSGIPRLNGVGTNTTLISGAASVNLAGSTNQYTVPQTLYIRTNGNDAKAVAGDPSLPWATVQAVVAAAPPNSTIQFGPGIFNLDQVAPNTNVWMKGMGRGITTIVVTNSNVSTNTQWITLTNGDIISDLTLTRGTDPWYKSYPIAAYNGVSNWILNNVEIIADSDTITASAAASGKLINCRLYTRWDSFTTIGGGPAGNGSIWFYNCETVCVATNSPGNGPNSQLSGIHNSANVLYYIGGSIFLSGSTNQAINVWNDGSAVTYLSGVLLTNYPSANMGQISYFIVGGSSVVVNGHPYAQYQPTVNGEPVFLEDGGVRWLGAEVLVATNAHKLNYTNDSDVGNAWFAADGFVTANAVKSPVAELQTGITDFSLNPRFQINAGDTAIYGPANGGPFRILSAGDATLNEAGGRNLLVAKSALLGGIITTNGMTNLAATANTAAKFDGNRGLVSVANAAGALTNDGSGNIGWLPGIGGGGSGTGIQTNGGTGEFNILTNTTHVGNTNGAIAVIISNAQTTATAALTKWYGTNGNTSQVNASGSLSIGTTTDNGPGGIAASNLSLIGPSPGSYFNIGSANSLSNTFSSTSGSNDLELTIGNTHVLSLTNPEGGNNVGWTIQSGVNYTNQNFGTGIGHYDANGKHTSSALTASDVPVSTTTLQNVFTNPIFAGNVTQTNGTYLGTNSTAPGGNWWLISADLFKMSNGVFQTQVTLTSTNLSLAGAAINAGVSFGSGNGLSNSIFTQSGSNDGAFRFGYQTNNIADTNGNFYLLDAAFFRNTLGVLGAVFTTNGLNVGTTFEVGGQTWASNTVTITAGGANITGVITNNNSLWWQTNALSGTVWAPTIDCTQPYIGMPMWTSNLAVNGIANVPAIGSGKVPDFWVEVTNNDSSVHQVTFPAGTTLYNSAFATNVTGGIFCSNHATVIFKVLLFPQNGQYRTNILAWQQAN